jgi:Tfp pilus assembly protein PilV
MFSSVSRDSGITMIESIVAILLVSIGLIGLLSMQPSAWRASARADYLGHAAMVLSEELTRQELWIMNPCNAVSTGTVPQTVNASGQGTAQSGDTSYSVQTTIASIGTNIWRVSVRVSWPPLNTTGITESIVVTRQDSFRFPLGCI